MKFEQDIINYLLNALEKQIFWDQTNNFIEDHESHCGLVDKQLIQKSSYSYNQLAYHLQLMFEEGLLIVEYNDLTSTERTVSSSYQSSISPTSPPISLGVGTNRVRGKELTYRLIGRETRLITNNTDSFISHNVLGLSSKGQDTLAAISNNEFMEKTSKTVKQVGFNTLNALVSAAVSFVVGKYM